MQTEILMIGTDEKPDTLELEDEAGYVPTIEDFAPSPPPSRGPLSYWPQPQAIRPALWGLVLFLIFSAIHWSSGKLSPVTVSGAAIFEHREYYRLLTALFAHADLGHLLANTPLFLIFGWALYAYFGSLVFPIATIFIGVLSNLATIAFYPPEAQLLGASGMLYGMVALWLVLYVKFDTDHPVATRILRATAAALLLLFPTTFHETTSYLAHATGFGIGLIAGLLLIMLVQVKLPLEHENS